MSDLSAIIDVASFSATTIDASVQSFIIPTYYAQTPYTSPPIHVRRVGEQPSHPWQFQSADGGWWEGYSSNGRDIDIGQFGAVKDAWVNYPPTDDWPAISNAIAYIENIPNKLGATYFQIGYTLNIGIGCCYSSQTIVMRTGWHLRGENKFMGSGRKDPPPDSGIMVPPGMHGIDVQHTAAGFRISGLGIYSTLNCGGAERPIHAMKIGPGFQWPTAAQDCHGIHVRAYGIIEDCQVEYFQTDGINIHCNGLAPPTSDIAGNVNCAYVRSCYCSWNARDGVHVEGPDTNVNTFVNLSCTNNGGWGVYDGSYLGNVYIGCHTAGNAWTSYNTLCWNRSVWVYEDGYYYQIIYGKEAQAQTARPSLSPTVWRKMGSLPSEGTRGPTWGRVFWNGQIYDVVQGQEASMWASQPDTSPDVWTVTGTPTPLQGYICWANNISPYQNGGAYLSLSACVWVGCYSETGQPPNYFPSSLSVWLGGTNAAGFSTDSMPSAFVPQVANLSLLTSLVSQRNAISGDVVKAGLGGNANNGDWLTYTHSKAGDSYYGLRYRVADGAFLFGYGALPAMIFGASGLNTTWAFGKNANAPQPYSFCPSALYIAAGPPGSVAQYNARLLTNGTSAPSAGVFAVGDTVMNRNPVPGGVIGWICVTAGALGPAWKPSTAYAAFSSVVNNGGTFYYCVGGGISAASGGPSGTGIPAAPIIDGTVKWTSVGTTAAVFAPYGNSVLEIASTYAGETIAVGAAGAVNSVPLPGAALGDYVDASFSLDRQGLSLEAWIHAANSAQYRFSNPTSASVSLSAGSVKVRVRK